MIAHENTRKRLMETHELKAGKTLAEVQAAKLSATFDTAWGKGIMTPDDFVALVYNTVR